jgi:hypothetical protein
MRLIMTKNAIGNRVAEEAKKALQLTLYFWLWFSAIGLLTHEILRQHGLPLGSWGLAIVKAAICAKFVLIGQAIYPMRHTHGKDLWGIVLPRSFVYLIVVLLLSVLEAGIEGAWHGHGFLVGMGHFANGDLTYAFALAWVYWLILVPYLLMGSMDRLRGNA